MVYFIALDRAIGGVFFDARRDVGGSYQADGPLNRFWVIDF
jgi:hypothetical protein